MSFEHIYEYGAIFLRSIISFLVLLILTRLLGKKQISQLTLFDYVTGITIGSIAASLAIDTKISFSHGIIGLIIWTILPIAVSYITLKNTRLKRLFDGTPSILIQNGKIVYANLKKERFSVVDLLEELRLKEVFNICDVEFAILETSGKLSVQLKSQKQPLTPSDLNIPTSYDGLSANLIIDGEIMHEHLKLVNFNKEWLENELKIRNIKSTKEVVLAILDSTGNLAVFLKAKIPEENRILE
jgi:uncharacterized membrane protein YcaP (DUF421 family)